MKGFLYALAVMLTLVWIVYIAADIHAGFEYENRVESYWDLGVKASTLQTKADYLDKFVAALDAANLNGNRAWLWQTPDNDYSQNYTALKSLQTRMHEIQGMDVKSFEYQQAISQITAQEQGEAAKLLYVFKDVWFKCNHTAFWGPWEFLGIFGLLIISIFLYLAAALAD